MDATNALAAIKALETQRSVPLVSSRAVTLMPVSGMSLSIAATRLPQIGQKPRFASPSKVSHQVGLLSPVQVTVAKPTHHVAGVPPSFRQCSQAQVGIVRDTGCLVHVVATLAAPSPQGRGRRFARPRGRLLGAGELIPATVCRATARSRWRSTSADPNGMAIPPLKANIRTNLHGSTSQYAQATRGQRVAPRLRSHRTSTHDKAPGIE